MFQACNGDEATLEKALDKDFVPWTTEEDQALQEEAEIDKKGLLEKRSDQESKQRKAFLSGQDLI